MSTRNNYFQYFETRIYARRSTFLSESAYEEMIGYSDVNLVLKHLLSTPYEQDITEALIQHHNGDAVEAGVGKHLEYLFSELLGMANYLPGQEHDLAYFLSRWDLVAIKTLLRYVACGITIDTNQLCTGPKLPWSLVTQLSETADLEELALRLNKLFPGLCRSLPAVLKAGADTPQALLESLESALDRDYFGRFAGVSPRNNTQKIIREYMAVEIDRINLRTVLSNLIQKGHSSEVARWHQGGVLSPKLLDNMLSSGSVESALILLGTTPYRSVHQVFYQIIEQGRLSGFDRKFEMFIVEKLQKLIWQYPFSGALFMHFVWKKWIEAANLRVLARGIELHLPAGRIREELVYV